MTHKAKGTMQSDLGRARGLGPSHHGVGHWWHQRVTALANIGLMAWLICAVICMPGWSYTEFVAWIGAPINAILMILACISVFYHAALGTQVVAEDYVHSAGLRRVTILAMQFVFFAAAVACIFSVLKIALI